MPPRGETARQDAPTPPTEGAAPRARVAQRLATAIDAAKRAARKRSGRRFRTMRDTATGIALALLIVGGLYLASDGAWPPLLVIESHSMMHDKADTQYGRYGTVDVGDVLLVRSVDGPDDIRTWAQNGPERYGRPGDVIVFAARGDRANVSVVHRAMAYVEVVPHENLSATYRVHWIDGEVLEFGNEGIYLPALGFHEAWGFTPQDGYRPMYSGFITKGDNPGSNSASDQATNLTGPVQFSWIEGKAYGEVPWLGLVKLIFQWDQTNPQVAGWQRVGNGFAPVELWTCLFASLAVLILIPLAWDTQRAVRAHVKARRLQRAEDEAMERRLAAQRQAEEEARRRRAEERARRGPVEFQPITRG